MSHATPTHQAVPTHLEYSAQIAHVEDVVKTWGMVHRSGIPSSKNIVQRGPRVQQEVVYHPSLIVPPENVSQIPILAGTSSLVIPTHMALSKTEVPQNSTGLS